MLVNHNSIIGVNSITADGDQLYFYKEDGTDAIFNISNINVLNTSGVSTFAGLESTGDLVIGGNVSVGGTLTYEDVTNVDSVGIVTARIGVKVPAGEVTVGNNIQLGNAGVITATSFVGSSQIGIQSGGVQIGAGITQLNFIGAGNTFAVNGNTIDVSIQGGAGGSVDSDAQENTVAGSNAGNALDSDTERNTIFGFDTGKLIDSGDDNTLMGWKTGDAITSGYKNTAVGSEALPNCNSGHNNVAMGWEAGRSLTDGYNNVALGNMSGRSWGSANECIAIGVHAASNFGLGTRVIAMGGESVWLGGTDVIGLGKQTMLRGGGQTGGIGIGYYAGQNNVGDYNVYIGYEAGKGFGSSPYTTGEYNLSLGYRSLYAVSSGNNNISIGHSTGTTITTGSNNILIGNNVQASSATATNEVVIGDSNITKFSVPGINFVNTGGNLGIGTDNPEYDLDIGGLVYSLSPSSAGVGTARFASRLGIGVTNFTRTGATPVEKHGGVLSLGGDATTGDNPMIVFDSYPASTSFVNVVIGSDETGRRLNGNTGCVYIGGHAGRLNTGGNNIAIGSQSLSGGGGSFVYAIGYRAGTEGTGQDNVCIGKNAGATYNGTAGNNIFLGHNAGSIGGGDYDNNILIGSGAGNAEFGPAKSANDQLAIGFRGSAGLPSKYWIVGDENLRIGIGTNLPSAKIHINNDPNTILGRFDSNNKRCIDLVSNDATGDAEIRGFKNTGSGTHEQTILLDASGNSYLKGGSFGIGTDSVNGSVSNSAQVVGGLFKSFSGSNGGTSSGVSVTLFTVPNGNATYMVTAGVYNTQSAGLYSEVAVVCANAGASVSLDASIVKDGGLMSISVSGANVQASQGSGTTQTISWTATRIA